MRDYEDRAGRGVRGREGWKEKRTKRSSESVATGQEGRRRVEKRVASTAAVNGCRQRERKCETE